MGVAYHRPSIEDGGKKRQTNKMDYLRRGEGREGDLFLRSVFCLAKVEGDVSVLDHMPVRK